MEYTLDRPEVFPVETAVGLYYASSVPDTTRAPIGAALDTQLVGFVEEVENEAKEMENVFGNATAVAFEEVDEGRNYVAGAKVDGVWRYVRFVPGTMGKSLDPPARFPSHPAG